MRLVLVWVIAVLAVLPAAAETVEIDREFEETFAVDEGAQLQLYHGDGDVTVTPWEKDEIHVFVRYRGTVRAWGAFTQREFEVEFQQSDNLVRVTAKEPSGQGFGIFAKSVEEYHYHIQAPPTAKLYLRGDDGDVELSGWRENVEVSGDDGDLVAEDIVCDRLRVLLEDGDARITGLVGELWLQCDDGDVEILDSSMPSASLSTADGDVTLDRCRADLVIRVDDGDVDLRALSTDELSVTSEDGHVRAEVVGGSLLDVDLTTDDGRIVLSVPADVSAMVAIGTDDGDVSITHGEFGAIEESEHYVSGQIGTGDGSIRIRTADGDVELREIFVPR